MSGIKILVIGHRQHGKGTFCKIAKNSFSLDSISSSMMANNMFIFSQLKEQYGYTTPIECFNDRDDKREQWYQAILAYNTPERTRLASAIFQKYPIYDGLRSKLEFDAIRKAKMVDLVIWIDAAKRQALEPETSITVTRSDADLIIENNDTEEAFVSRVTAFLKTLNPT
jgi:hypothetical protein